jgi:hypothetical protein
MPCGLPRQEQLLRGSLKLMLIVSLRISGR